MKSLQQSIGNRNVLLSVFLPLVLALSLSPSVAVAETLNLDEQASGGAQPSITLEMEASDIDVDGLADVEALQDLAAEGLTVEADGDADANAEKGDLGGDIAVTVGLASESNAHKDLYVGMGASQPGS